MGGERTWWDHRRLVIFDTNINILSRPKEPCLKCLLFSISFGRDPVPELRWSWPTKVLEDV